MITFLQKYFILILNIFVISTIGIFYFLPLDFNIYYTDFSLKLFFRIIIGIIVILTTTDVFSKRKILFNNIDPFRLFITIFASLLICIYPYKHKMVLGLAIALLSLCLLYGFYKKTFYKPHPIMIILFLLSCIKFLSLLWSDNFSNSFHHIDYYCLFIMLPIVSCFYKVEKKELYPFIYIPFIVFINLMTLNIISYVLLVKQYQKPLFSFLSLSKGYLGDISYIETMKWSVTLHQSMIGWGFLLVFVMGYWLWRENKQKWITSWHIIFYFILLIIVSLIIQARVVILGIGIIMLIFLWVELMKKVKSRKKIIYYTSFTSLIILFLLPFLIIKKNNYFNDEIRNRMNTAAWESFKESPFLGKGAGSEEKIILKAGYDFHTLHNDYLSTLVEQGLIGFFFIILFHIFVIYFGIKDKYLLGIYVLITFFLFNTTEGIMGSPICIPLFLFCLLPPEFSCPSHEKNLSLPRDTQTQDTT
jgi:membrane protein